jgi:uncharacterized glyoxalase superfamily protein PhnB
MSKVKAIPAGYHTVTPFLSLKDASKAIEFYKKAFGATEVECHRMDDGRIMHAVVKIGDSLIMLADEFPESGCGISSPKSMNGSTVMLHIYIENVDKAFEKAVAAGANVKMPVSDMFWGDRYGQLEDPFGHLWSLATHIADYSEEKIEQGAKECMKGNCC